MSTEREKLVEAVEEAEMEYKHAPNYGTPEDLMRSRRLTAALVRLNAFDARQQMSIAKLERNETRSQMFVLFREYEMLSNTLQRLDRSAHNLLGFTFRPADSINEATSYIASAMDRICQEANNIEPGSGDDLRRAR